MNINPYTKDKTMMWVKNDTHKILKNNANKKGAKLYVYLDYIIKLGLETERKRNEIQKHN